MKSLRNKVILSGIVLVFAFIATIGSTYAWFTVASSAEVESMTLNVTAADNLLIRVNDSNVPATGTLAYLQDQSNYGSYISEADLAEFLLTGGVANRLQPSTVLGGTVEYLSYVNNIAALDDVTEPVYAAATENDPNGHYIKLEFWVLSQSEDPKPIELSSFTITAGTNADPDQDDIANAVRLSVRMSEAAAGDYTPAAPQADGDYYIFGNDGEYDFAFTGTDPVYSWDANGAPAVTTDALTEYPVYASGAAASSVYSLAFNVPTLVEVYIFIEGWDLDADNDIILAQFNIAFGFKYSE
jgi:hypothetical protein